MIYFILLLSVFITQITFGQTELSYKPKINSIGMGTVNAFPNAAQITISLIHTKPTLREAINENQKTMDEVTQVVKKYIVDTTDFKISLISTGKATKWNSRRDSEVFIGYQSTQKLIFTLKNLDKMQDFTEELLKTKFNKIEKISYFNIEANEYIKQAEELAVIDAIETTNRLARISNIKTGKIIFMQSNKSPNDNSNNRVDSYSFETFGKGMGGRGVSSSGDLIKYTVTVTIHTEIID
jgi:uncharacterized protein YggE